MYIFSPSILPPKYEIKAMEYRTSGSILYIYIIMLSLISFVQEIHTCYYIHVHVHVFFQQFYFSAFFSYIGGPIVVHILDLMHSDV